MLFQPGLTGVCGVLTYQLELDPSDDPEYIQVMFSVPYNLNSYDSYLAVGVSPVYLNSSDGGVFKTFYYYSGAFQRAKAGRMAEYQSEKGEAQIMMGCPQIWSSISSCLIQKLGVYDHNGEWVSDK